MLLIQLFLSYGANTHGRDVFGRTPLDAAVHGKHALAILLLTRHENPKSSLPSLDSFTPAYEAVDILTAARIGDTVLMRRCLNRSLDVRRWCCILVSVAHMCS